MRPYPDLDVLGYIETHYHIEYYKEDGVVGSRLAPNTSIKRPIETSRPIVKEGSRWSNLEID